MRIGLIDIDSKIPNLALMKLSAYYKRQGHQVELTAPLYANQYDQIYASKVFNFTPIPILPRNALVGGSGVDLEKNLTNEVEHTYPDYGLYKCDYAIGYTSRGCNRKCPFCVVPKKEGGWKAVADIHEFWNGQKHLLLLDNSLNTNEGHFIKICNQIEKNNIRVDFNQGLDIRLFTDIQARTLTRLQLWGQTPIRFSWDLIQIEKNVRSGIEILTRHNLQHKTMFYVLIGFNTTPEEDLYRVETLRSLDVEPFVMPFNKFNDYQHEFARWVNYKAIFKSVEWEQYNA